MKRLKVNENDNPTIYLIATPIGNLQEISQRAIAVLNEVEYIYCEDTRVSAKLLNLLNIKNKKLSSYHLHNEREKLDAVVEKVINEKKIALISDAGYPLLSDPGESLIKKAKELNINVVCINGSNALLPALLYSGFPTQPFLFLGFLPNKQKDSLDILNSYRTFKGTIVLYESIHHLNKTLRNILDTLGDVEIAIIREITKLNEEHIFGNTKELLDANLELKGELVIVINNRYEKEIEEIDEKNIIEFVNKLCDEGLSKKDAIKKVSKNLGLEKNYVYNVVHKIEID